MKLTPTQIKDLRRSSECACQLRKTSAAKLLAAGFVEVVEVVETKYVTDWNGFHRQWMSSLQEGYILFRITDVGIKRLEEDKC